jgi:hypothetical protein
MFTSVTFGKILSTLLFVGLIFIAFSFRKEDIFGEEPYHLLKDLRLWVVVLSVVLTAFYWIF